MRSLALLEKHKSIIAERRADFSPLFPYRSSFFSGLKSALHEFYLCKVPTSSALKENYNSILDECDSSFFNIQPHIKSNLFKPMTHYE